jgi:large subunit ribosomal protein L7/L12
MRCSFLCALLALTVSIGIAAEADHQYGEAILPADQAPVDAPLRRYPKASWFELSNLRNETRAARAAVALDFRRISDDAGWHEVIMVVKSAAGRREFRSIGPSPFAERQGTVRGQSWFGSLRGLNEEQIEVWLEEEVQGSPKPIRIKVSKSLTLGNVGQVTLARHWKKDEQAFFDAREKAATPPPAPPAGYLVATADTKLLPGMPILAGWMGAWKAAEVIEARSNKMVLVKYNEATQSLTVRPRSWVAVESTTLEAAKKDPAKFHASVRVLPGGTTVVPDDLRPLEADMQLLKGVPLKAEWGGRWLDVTVLEPAKDGKVRIHWDSFNSHWDEDRDTSALLISADTLEVLKKPGAADVFAKRAEKLEPGTFGAPSTARRRLHDYPIRIPLPKTAVRVTDETPLEKGTKLGCSWGNQWYNVTVLEVNDDNTVKIHWEKFGDAWDADISRECLAIDKKVLAKLEASDKTATKEPPTSTASGDEASKVDRFKVVLKSFGTKRVAVTKVVMEATGLDLKDAKEFVEAVPVTIKQNLTKAAANELRNELEQSGGTVAIELQ